MSGVQAQFDADIKLMTDTALSSTFFIFVLGQILIPPSKLFNSVGENPQILMHLKTSLIEC
jgi:hypothetical protein